MWLALWGKVEMGEKGRIFMIFLFFAMECVQVYKYSDNAREKR